MILTVTPNPAHDITYEVPRLEPGGTVRVATSHVRPGGKGLNVAAVLSALDEEVVVTGLSSPGFAEEVSALGLHTELVTVLQEVRRTVTVVEPGRTTSLWESGADLPVGAVERLHERVDTLLDDAACVVVAGSLPPGAPESLAADLAGRAIAAGVPVVVDTSGAALRAAAAVPGVVIMPNADELAQLVGPCPSPADVAHHTRSLVTAGARAVIATCGPDGMVATDSSGTWVAAPPGPVAGNPTGAGDAAAAAVARGLAGGRPLPEIVADAVALSAAAVAAPVAGTVDLDRYRALVGAVATHPAPVPTVGGTR